MLLKLATDDIGQPNLLKVFIFPILQHFFWLCAYVVANVKN